jgi:dienelactone hydrolase
VTIWRKLAIGSAVAVIIIAGAGYAGKRDLHGWALVFRAANGQGVLRRLADIDTVPIDERLVSIPGRDGSVRARVYEPLTIARQTVLLVSGLHPAGIDEPRLIDLARKLAEANVVVVTPDIPELSRFEVTPVVTRRIEETGVWLATASGLAPSGRIGLMGVSFSGGLAMVAAGRPSLRDHLRFVLSLGGHDDLLRVLRYFCTGVDSSLWHQTGLPPHDYGVAIVLLNVAQDLVPPEQVAPLTDGVRRFLWASYLDTVDKAQANRLFVALRAEAKRLPEPSARLLDYVNNRDVAHLGPLLLPHVGAYAGAAALSPARSPLPTVPVFLLHGRDDTVIPSSEAQFLAARLRGRAATRLLVSDLLSHANADQPPHVTSIWHLAHFWGDVLSR